MQFPRRLKNGIPSQERNSQCRHYVTHSIACNMIWQVFFPVLPLLSSGTTRRFAEHDEEKIACIMQIHSMLECINCAAHTMVTVFIFLYRARLSESVSIAAESVHSSRLEQRGQSECETLAKSLPQRFIHDRRRAGIARLPPETHVLITSSSSTEETV